MLAIPSPLVLLVFRGVTGGVAPASPRGGRRRRGWVRRIPALGVLLRPSTSTTTISDLTTTTPQPSSLTARVSQAGTHDSSGYTATSTPSCECSCVEVTLRPSACSILAEIAGLKCLTKLTICHFSIRIGAIELSFVLDKLLGPINDNC